MAREAELTLPEEILLLTLREREGTVMDFGTHWRFAVAGAVIAELLLGGRLQAVRERKKVFLEPAGDATSPDDPLLAECLERVRGAKRRATVQIWVRRFARLGRLNHRVAAPLCRRGILRESEQRVLRLFRQRVYPELDPRPEKALRERMRRAIFGTSTRIAPRTAIVVNLARSANLLDRIFEAKKLRARKKRLQRLAAGDLVGGAAQKAVQEATAAAVMVSVMIPAVSGTAVSSG
jgi:hypothetical protein